ncbi:MAG TPA: AMP-binding protein [Firmicutes bacterium]|uniref:AMP-binding protein n=1 Tax=Capillibacterium thermochitinicola TaxID=2699427 RepID=A0A8J6HQM1_9FIRM|nr:AMP-binding protein [Capillibacterium thermochitinicola]MBA2132261.1 AMP-binding protein [Capillibacterium thermochitinicola]HHW12929.1 AMP-binding protein [Bacillota bacterium]
MKEYVTGEYQSYEEFLHQFKLEAPANFNFAYDVVDRIAAETPDRVALVWCNEEGESKIISFAEMKEYSDRVACFLKRVGIKKGDKVMLILKRRYEFWYTLLGLHKVGATAVPATHLLTAQDIIYRNQAAEVKMIIAVADPQVLAHVEEAAPASPSLQWKVMVNGEESRPGWLNFTREVAASEPVFPRTAAEEVTPEDISLLYFTSGTTGHPKMVAHNFQYPLGHVVTAKYWQRVKEGGLHLTVAETGWAKAVWGKIYGQWMAGSAVFVYDFDRFNAQNLLRMLEKYKVTTFCAPPTVYRYLIKEDLGSYDLSALEYCVVAGEPLNPEVYHQFYKMTGLELREGYGQTELTVAIATFPWLKPKPGSMGKPAPGYEVELIDDEGHLCEVGEVGQITIRTDRHKPLGFFAGYYRDPEKTQAVWHDGRYYTGDTAWRDEDGYYWFVGRVDDVIKSSGYRIGPFEVESALMEHPAVLECAVTGIPDPDRGQVVKATVVLAPGYTPSDQLAKELQEHVKRVTAPYKYPRVIEFRSELPKTISGKIRRVQIREEHQNR